MPHHELTEFPNPDFIGPIVTEPTTTDSIDREQWLEIDKLYRSMSAWQLAERLRTVEADHEKDKQAWMAENTDLLTQVARLTEALADMGHADYLGRTRLDITNDSLAVRKLNGELRKQVERLTEERDELLKEHIDLQIYPKDMIEKLQEQVRALTAERDMNITWLQNRDHDVQLQKIVIGQLREQVERLTVELEVERAKK